MIVEAEKIGFDDDLCGNVRAELDELDTVTNLVLDKASTDYISSVAVDYMNLFGTTIIACLWLKVAAESKKQDAQSDFETQLQNQARFFCTYHLAANDSAKKRIQNGARNTMAMSEKEFELMTEVN